MTTTATEQISAVSVINMLGEIVDGHEDLVDAECVYYLDGHPQCIVGHVLAAYGYDEDWFLDRPASFTTPFYTLVRDYGLPFSTQAVSILDVAQKVQDSGESWGRAYRAALVEMDAMRESESP